MIKNVHFAISHHKYSVNEFVNYIVDFVSRMQHM